jgi:hypothetical protein
MHEHNLRPGGVMRCCIETLSKHIGRQPETVPVAEGDRLGCLYCSSGLIYRDGAWEWDRS